MTNHNPILYDTCSCGRQKRKTSPLCRSCTLVERATHEEDWGHCPICGGYIFETKAPRQTKHICVYCLSPVVPGARYNDEEPAQIEPVVVNVDKYVSPA
jgi:hypothetical protein